MLFQFDRDSFHLWFLVQTKQVRDGSTLRPHTISEEEETNDTDISQSDGCLWLICAGGADPWTHKENV